MTHEEIIAARLRKQVGWCQELGSPLYAGLMRRAAEDVLRGGPCAAVLAGHHDDSPGSALALRFMGAVHRLVLQGQAPELAACYPSTGGDAAGDAWPAFVAAVETHAGALRQLVNRPVQTNEVGRCAALAGGFLEIARRTRLPLSLFEIGAAAGLNLRWDCYRYQQGSAAWGPKDSPLLLAGMFEGALPPFSARVAVMQRRGCDRSPIDATSKDGRLTLRSYVWPDQIERLRLLDAALDIAARVPARVEQANAADWLVTALSSRPRAAVTVVFHSIVWQYLPAADRQRITEALEGAGEAATADAPLAWLRMEAGEGVAEVRLRLWPGGEDRLLATAGFHGRPVRWLGM